MRIIARLFSLWITLLCVPWATAAGDDVTGSGQAVDPSAAPAAGPVLPGQETAEKLFERNRVGLYVLSPSGRYLAYIRWYPAGFALVISDTETQAIVHRQKLSNVSPYGLDWLSDSRLIYGLKGKVYAINRDGSDRQVLINHIYDQKASYRSYVGFKRHFRGWWVEHTLPDDEEHILVRSVNSEGYESVHKINIFSGEKEDLLDGLKLRVNAWHIDPEGNVRLAVRSNNRKVRFFALKEASNSLVPVHRLDKTYQFDISGETYLNARAMVLGASYQEGRIYLSENSSSDRFRVVEYDIWTGESQVIHEDPEYDVGDSASPAQLLFDHVAKKLVGIRYNRDREVTVWFDPGLQEIQDTIDRAYPETINTITQWSRDRATILLRSWSEKTMGRWMTFLPASRQMQVQSIMPPELDAAALSKTTSVKYRSFDGHEIEAYLTIPAGAEKAEKLPLIVLPHGGPFLRSHWGYSPYVQYFAMAGYAVIEPNFRGSTGYGREHVTAGQQGLHKVMIDDIAFAARWAIREGLAAPDRVYILGFSYGGYAAVMSSVRYPELFAAAVSYSAPLDIGEQIKWYRKTGSRFAYEFWTESVLGGKRNAKSLREVSPTSYIEQIGIPTMIAHGGFDRVVPIMHYEKFEEKKNKVEAKLAAEIRMFMLAREGHTISERANQIFFAKKAVNFFAEFAP